MRNCFLCFFVLCLAMLEDHEGDLSFDYLALKKELHHQYKKADSDYELIRKIMERKQQPTESFE